MLAYFQTRLALVIYLICADATLVAVVVRQLVCFWRS